MQIHEITINKKVNEGFMDAVKGIGTVAAQGLNQAIGTNIGGAEATAQVGLGQRKQTALQTNTPLARQQAAKLARHYVQTAGQTPTTSALAADLQRIVKTLLPRVRNYRDLPSIVTPEEKAQANQIVANIDRALQLLSNPDTATNPGYAETIWLDLTTAAAEAENLYAFSQKSATATPTKATAGNIDPRSGQDLGNGLSLVGGAMYYNGRPVDPNDRVAMDAVTKYLQSTT